MAPATGYRRGHRPRQDLRPEFAGKYAAAAWEKASIEVRRSVVRMLMRVTILPSGPGRSFDPASVQIKWLGTGTPPAGDGGSD